MADTLDRNLIGKDSKTFDIAEQIIKLAKDFHIPGKDPVGELYNVSLAVSQHIGLEMEVMKMREKGEIA